MAPGIVEGLEIVDIHNHQRADLVLPVLVSVDQGFAGGSVEQTGEGISARLLPVALPRHLGFRVVDQNAAETNVAV